jgi:hypothetical protein
MIAKFAIDKEFYQECCMAIPTIILKYDPKEMIRNYDAVYTEIIQKRVL